MSEKKEIMPFKLEDGTEFFIEVDKKSSSSTKLVSKRDGTGAVPDIAPISTTFEQALDKQVIPVAQAALGRIQQGLSVNEVELKFGIKVTGETGAIIASVGGEVNFEVTLKWKKDT
jgi:hypothetical protein